MEAPGNEAPVEDTGEGMHATQCPDCGGEVGGEVEREDKSWWQSQGAPQYNPDEDYEPTVRLDANGKIALDRVIHEDGTPVKNYPLKPDPRDRRCEFENAMMHGYLTKLALERGEPPPERRYQSEFDRKWCQWCDRNTDRYYRLRAWAEKSMPRTLWVTDKIHDGMFWVGEKASDAFGLTQSRYQWVIDAAEWQAYREQKEREEEEEAIREAEEERAAAETAAAAALEGGTRVCESAEADSGGGGVQCDTFYDSEALPGDSTLTKMDGVVAQQVECEEVATVDDSVAQEEAQVVEKRVCLENQIFDGATAEQAGAEVEIEALPGAL